MHKSIIISFVVLFTTTLRASPAQITKMYDDYEKQQKQFFASDLTRQNLSTKLTPLVKQWNEIFDAMTAIEVAEKLPPHEDRAQLAFDLTVLEALTEFAHSTMDVQSCGIARIENARESIGSDQQPVQPIVLLIDQTLYKLCK